MIIFPEIKIDKPTILVMLSGGLDSLAMLFILLTDAEYSNMSIHAHHIVIGNEENRDKAESIAIKNIMAWFDKSEMKKFDYSESIIFSPSCNGNFFQDAEVTNFISGFICRSAPNVKYVAIGLTETDSNDPKLNDRISCGNDIFTCFVGHHGNVEKIYPIQSKTKRELFNMLPESLRTLAWSCRTPVYVKNMPIVCGSCRTCRDLIGLTS